MLKYPVFEKAWFSFSITQVAAFKKLIDILFTECREGSNFEIDENGVKINISNSSGSIETVLWEDKFSHFFCKGKCSIGINYSELICFMKGIKSDSTLIIESGGTDKDPDFLYLFEVNEKRNMISSFKMSSLDIDPKDPEIKENDIYMCVDVPSNTFLSVLQGHLNIASEKNATFLTSVKTKFGKSQEGVMEVYDSLRLSSSEEGSTNFIQTNLKVLRKSNTFLQQDDRIRNFKTLGVNVKENNKFQLKKLTHISRSSLLSRYITIQLMKCSVGMYLNIQYPVEDLGFVKFSLRPLEDDDGKTDTSEIDTDNETDWQEKTIKKIKKRNRKRKKTDEHEEMVKAKGLKLKKKYDKNWKRWRSK